VRKYLLTCLILLLFTVAAMAQQKKTTINLVQSSKSVTTKVNGADLYTVYNCVFQQKYSTLRADSAYVHLDQNTFDAFGHVVINQGDTLHIYSDKLNYNDNTKIAILTTNVKMVDKDATLTTNDFTYNTATKFGTYVNGGKLVNKDNVLVSKNGYYYADRRDAYFRYDVVLTTPDALIKTDTLRYNSGSRIAYFYGPTNMYGKKDKDTLYTENGYYNTKTEQAFFGKRNRYSQGTKSLKGDSLFYDRAKGYGKAIKNMTFEDKEQKMLGKGNLGEYFKKDDRVVLTQNAYVILVTEDRDTTKAADTVAKAVTIPAKGKAVQSTVKNSIPVVTGTKLPAAVPDKGKPAQKADSLAKVIAAMPEVKNTAPVVMNKLKDTAKTVLLNKPPEALPKDKAGVIAKNNKPVLKDAKALLTDTGKLTKKDTTIRIKRDSMFIGADTLETQIITYKQLKDLQEQRRLAGIRDTSIKLRKPFEPYKKIPQFLLLEMPEFKGEGATYRNRPLFTVVKPAPDTTQKKAAKPELADLKNKPVTDSLKTPDLKDAKKKTEAGDPKATKQAKANLPLKPVKAELSDTARVRILSAHHNVKIFKSDLQGKSDSLFYSSSDSVIRSFVKPLYWTQGAQLSGDTIYMQLKNKKLDNMDVFPTAFVVYVEDADSAHFNQVAGKRLKGYFRDSKLSRVDVNGNAETIYFNRNKKKIVTEMQRSLSSSITLIMKKGEVANLAFRSKPDHKIYPITKVKDDDKILKGFIWKPKERPASKEAVTNPVKVVPPPAKSTKPVKLPGKAAGKDSAKVAPLTLKLPLPAKRDSVKKDSVKKVGVMKKDTVVKKP
jgi:lipopolysaccharide export system protein LptA